MQVEIVFSLHNVHIYQYGIDSFILGKSNSLIFNHFCVRQFMQFSFLVLFSLLFFLCFFASHPALGTPINAKKNQRSKNDAKKEITYNTTSTWTVKQRNCKIRDYFTVDSPLMSDKTSSLFSLFHTFALYYNKPKHYDYYPSFLLCLTKVSKSKINYFIILHLICVPFSIYFK